MARRRSIRYRKVRPRLHKLTSGLKTMDEVTGNWGYDDDMVTDPFGYLVDGSVPGNVDDADSRFEGDEVNR